MVSSVGYCRIIFLCKKKNKEKQIDSNELKFYPLQIFSLILLIFLCCLYESCHVLSVFCPSLRSGPYPAMVPVRLHQHQQESDEEEAHAERGGGFTRLACLLSAQTAFKDKKKANVQTLSQTLRRTFFRTGSCDRG